MTIAEAIETLRGDIASIELSDKIGVSIDADWPQRMMIVLVSHDKPVAALREIRDGAIFTLVLGNSSDPNDRFVEAVRRIAAKALADLTEEQEP